jgi:Ferritin-like
LMPASRELFRETFMKIEQPAQPDAPPQEDEFTTIGQLYKAIAELVDRYDQTVGTYDTRRQSIDWNFGNNGGTVIEVTDRTSAMQAINEIIEQGEGADLTNRPGEPKYEIKQPWGQYEYYGPRTDGTYGPVLGTPLEMSHYFKFKAIADGATPLPPVYPMTPNPGRDGDTYSNPVAQQLSDLFDLCYSEMVDRLQTALQSGRPAYGEQDVFYTRVVPLMRVGLPVLATQLMQTPTHEKKYTSVDPVAGPAFRYVQPSEEDCGERWNEIIRHIDALRKMASTRGELARSDTLLQALAKVKNSLPSQADVAGEGRY